MEMVQQTSWKSRLRPLVPPLLLHLYREMRYGAAYRDFIAKQQASLHTGVKAVEFDLPSRTLNELFPGIESQLVSTPVSELYRPPDMVVPLPELLTLAAICRYTQPQSVFEIGTYTGSSTLVMAINVPDSTEIVTLDLEPSETVGIAYRDTKYASKIRQLYGNSLTFNYSDYLGKIDFVLVDANHSYEYVKSDTEKAFALLRPGGVIVWDDYRWLDCHAECVGVTLCLNELQAKRKVFSITGTRFAIYVDDQSQS